MRCCFNCRFFELGAYNQCREPQAERVLEKDRSNFCDYFSAAPTTPSKGSGGDDPRNKLENLFRKT
jgi:hypothetical protein